MTVLEKRLCPFAKTQVILYVMTGLIHIKIDQTLVQLYSTVIHFHPAKTYIRFDPTTRNLTYETHTVQYTGTHTVQYITSNISCC